MLWQSNLQNALLGTFLPPSLLVAECQGDEPRFTKPVVYLLGRLLKEVMYLVALGLGPTMRLPHLASKPVGLLALIGGGLRDLGFRFDEAFTYPALFA